MNFREKMHPLVSNAETDLFKKLSKAGLTGGLLTQFEVDLSDVAPPEYTLNGKKFKTIIDFAWIKWIEPNILVQKALYLDGDAVHKGKRMDTDEVITRCLELKGWVVKRIRHRGKVTPKMFEEIREWLQK